MYIEQVNTAIEKQREILLNHPLYSKIKTPKDLQVFMENHVFAVWDFMSLLKALQIKLTCVSIPWQASEFPQTRYLINEIVLAEESDIGFDGSRLSHFEMYTKAMKALKADTVKINNLLSKLSTGTDLKVAIDSSNLPLAVKDFLNFTFTTIERGEAHEIAATFTFGREDLIPGMFTSILKELQINFPNADLNELIYYFERHIELDADEHGPMALQMVSELCADDPKKWEQVIAASQNALDKRIALWDSIEKQIN
ncbi:DUF3050 domain-containing protein [Myroides sp. LJL115]